MLPWPKRTGGGAYTVSVRPSMPMAYTSTSVSRIRRLSDCTSVRLLVSLPSEMMTSAFFRFWPACASGTASAKASYNAVPPRLDTPSLACSRARLSVVPPFDEHGVRVEPVQNNSSSGWSNCVRKRFVSASRAAAIFVPTCFRVSRTSRGDRHALALKCVTACSSRLVDREILLAESRHEAPLWIRTVAVTLISSTPDESETTPDRSRLSLLNPLQHPIVERAPPAAPHEERSGGTREECEDLHGFMADPYGHYRSPASASGPRLSTVRDHASVLRAKPIRYRGGLAGHGYRTTNGDSSPGARA